MRSCLAIIVLAALVQGCSRDEPPPPAPKPVKAAKVPHCFFKDAEAKDWALRRSGNELVVTGRAYRSDARYKTIFLAPEMSGRIAVLRPSIAVNDTGFATDDNWWDLEARLPAQAVETVEIRCGKKVLATLPAAPKSN